MLTKRLALRSGRFGEVERTRILPTSGGIVEVMTLNKSLLRHSPESYSRSLQLRKRVAAAEDRGRHPGVRLDHSRILRAPQNCQHIVRRDVQRFG